MTCYKLNEFKMFADVTDGIAIVINSETGIYFGMNGFATVVYENIIKGTDTAKIAEKLKTIPDVPADIEERFNKFIEFLLSEEIIIEGEEENTSVEIDEKTAKEDNYEINIKAYNDAQEMLLADPIHEIKEETGWTPEKDSIRYTKEETREREKKVID